MFDISDEKFTYENKMSIGIITLIMCVFSSTNHYIGSMGLIICLPAIFLIIPSPTVRNNKVLGIFTGIISLFGVCGALITFFDSYLDLSSLIRTIFLISSLLSLFCAFLLTIETLPNNQKKNIYCQHCGKPIKENSTYCNSCGEKI